MLYAALLADQSPQLPRLYAEQPAAQRAALDAILAASAAFHWLASGRAGRARAWLGRLPDGMRRHVEAAAAAPESAAPESAAPESAAARLPARLARRLAAAWMLRRPSSDFGDVAAAAAVVGELARAAVAPDAAAAATLVAAALRCGRAAAALALYGPADGLRGLRAALERRSPRVHFDVAAALVRGGDLRGALAVARAVRSRLLFHVLLALWAARRPGDARGVAAIVRAALAALDGRLLHSTHHCAIAAALAGPPLASAAAPARRRRLRLALRLHGALAPRLESPSPAAVARLVRAALDAAMPAAAFAVYRGAERLGSRAREPLLAALAGFLARAGDMRCIMHLTAVAARSRIPMTPRFYAAVICGLAHPRGVKHAMRAAAAAEPAARRRVLRFVRRLRAAELMLASMERCGRRPPPKARHALMHAWAVLAQPARARWHFDRLPAPSAPAWGILMYASVRAGDAPAALSILDRARRWLRSHAAALPQRQRQRQRLHPPPTSHLVNMALLALVEAGRGRAALALLDRHLGQRDLPASPGDPITLGLVTRTLIENGQFQKAIAVHDDVHRRLARPEALPELKAMLAHCLAQGDPSAALCVAARILRAGGTLTAAHWCDVLRLLCASQPASTEAVVRVYDQWCHQLGADSARGIHMPPALRADPVLAGQVRAALLGAGRKVSTNSAGPPAARRQKLALYRALLREIRVFPAPEMRRKLGHNARFVFELYRDLDPHSAHAHELARDGASQLQWLRGWRAHPEAVQHLLRPP
ncbi:hypothetical protein H4R18_003624 [Coemansia javaensis]|uniref:Complex 1 LYR protein domain-containing protein n=1 Tax=Coemansia javaensis TaxID=2761396 RepID=A0A9W8LH00_9FUNG|nr:hypothetical protein H4R18_003624 [Coemansia javaensis]